VVKRRYYLTGEKVEGSFREIAVPALPKREKPCHRLVDDKQLPVLLTVMQGRKAAASLEEAGEVITAIESAFLGNDLDRESGVH
jgi:hypothetical protein